MQFYGANDDVPIFKPEREYHYLTWNSQFPFFKPERDLNIITNFEHFIEDSLILLTSRENDAYNIRIK